MAPFSLSPASVYAMKLLQTAGHAGDAIARSWSKPLVAGGVTLLVYLARVSWSKTRFEPTKSNYFNYLAEAFLHGKVALLEPPRLALDLIFFQGHIYLYWPPFPALVMMPFVALFGVDVSDVVLTSIFGALSVAMLALYLRSLDRAGIAPLDERRRGLLVLATALGSVLLILAPVAGVWYTAQVVGFGLVLLGLHAGISIRGRAGYFWAGFWLACAMATRLSLVFNGIWLAWYLLKRDFRGGREWLSMAWLGVAPAVVALALLGWYNVARFGGPLDMGLEYHNLGDTFRADYERYGVFSLHYLPINVYYQFIAYKIFTVDQWKGSGIFWMTPLYLGAVSALWTERRRALTYWLAATCAVVYVPIGVLMGTGYYTFGPRYLLDFTPTLLVLVAMGLRRWPYWALWAATAVSIATYVYGSLAMRGW